MNAKAVIRMPGEGKQVSLAGKPLVFLVTGQDEHVHALLLKAILAAKRVEEHAAGTARVPFPLE